MAVIEQFDQPTIGGNGSANCPVCVGGEKPAVAKMSRLGERTRRRVTQTGQFALLLALWLTAFSPRLVQSSQDNAAILTVGQKVRGALKGGESRSFRVALEAGQFLHVVAIQQGIDFEVRLLDPTERLVVEMDSPNNTRGPEAAAVIAEQAGRYRIEIRSLSELASEGNYELRVEALRPATEADRRWIEAQVAYNQGQQLRWQGTEASRQSSIKKYEDALLLWRSVGDPMMEAHALCGQASAWRALGWLRSALDCYRRALELQQGVEGGLEVPYTQYNLGLASLEYDDPRAAQEWLEKALVQQRAMGDTQMETETIGNLGVAYFKQGEVHRALEYYQQALSVWRRLRDRRQEGLMLHNIGQVHEVIDDYQQALEYTLQALELRRALKDREEEADDLNNIGIIYGNLGEWGKALEYFAPALVLWRAAGDKRREAILLGNIGTAHAALNEVARAAEYFNQSLALHREVGNTSGETRILDLVGDLRRKAGDLSGAAEHYRQALQLRLVAKNRFGEARSNDNLGFLSLAERDFVKALEYFRKALLLYQRLGDRQGEARVLSGLARAEYGRGRFAEARRYIDEALALVESIRAGVGSQQLRASYLASVQNFYQLNQEILMRLDREEPGKGYGALAFEAAERARARSLIELLAESQAQIREGVDPALLERERKLIQLLNAKAQRRMELRADGRPESQIVRLDREISGLEDEYQQVQAGIRRNSPHYASLTQPRPLSLREIQTEVLSADSLLLEYSLGEERSHLWVVTRDSIAGFELPGREAIEQSARKVVEMLTARSRTVKGEAPGARAERIRQADAQLPQLAREFGSMVLGPVGSRFDRQQLLIVADGALQYIPFAMLPKPATGEPLMVDHEIVALPSASTLAVIRQELKGRQPAPRMLAVIADPVFSANDDRNIKSRSTRASTRDIFHDDQETPAVFGGKLSIPRLPYTRLEAERILALAAGQPNLKALDYKANLATVTNPELGRYRYVHFATHGLLDSERPGLSSLVLSLVNEKGARQEGFLRANEIYNLHLPAELVVLSACQSGLGKEIRGEGLVGLTRGFMYAGAARVVVSLWNVNDRATAELMSEFYRQMLREGQRPAAALRSAQVALWKQKQWSAPYFWAAFVLQGEPL